MDKRLYFELMVELSHKDTWVHYYFVCYKTFVILYNFNKLLSTPYDLMLCINPLCQTLSNALEKSQNTKQLISFFF